MPLFRTQDGTRTPGQKLAIAILIGIVLAVPLFMTWALVYDRQEQSRTAEASVTQGWGGPQQVATPILSVPFERTTLERVVEGGVERSIARTSTEMLHLRPRRMDLDSRIDPEVKTRSIYEAVVYDATIEGQLAFALPDDLERYGVAPDSLRLDRAELRFGVTDPKGLGGDPQVRFGGQEVALSPGRGSEGGAGFFAFVDAAALVEGPVRARFAYTLRGSRQIALDPDAGTTRWTVRSAWPHPSFQGGFLPSEREVGADGFTALYTIGNLALGQSLVTTGALPEPGGPVPSHVGERPLPPGAEGADAPVISFMQPVDLYSKVDRAAKYGFLHIGFTFLALLMFDVIGGRRISAVAYLLVGAALVLFFVMLLAFAEIIGFALAYLLAAAMVAGLVTLYSKAILGNWHGASTVGGLLGLLYAALYVLLGLESASLLIGSLMLFAALAAVMYMTRNLDWGTVGRTPPVEG